MTVRFLIALAAGLVLFAPAVAQNELQPVKAKAAPGDALATLLDKLHGQEVSFEPGTRLNDIPISEIFVLLSKQYDVAFVINEVSFRAADQIDIKDKKPTLSTTTLHGFTLHEFLTTLLDDLSATYLVKGKTIEIVPIAHAARVSVAAVDEDESGRKRLKQPLVSAVIKEKPLKEAVATLAERYELNVVVSPQAGDARTGLVTARLTNVPADKALELLAVQVELRVVRRGNTFLVTSRGHADELFNEKFEQERAKIELEKFRDAPPPNPQPEPAPQPKPTPKPEAGTPLILKLNVVPQPQK